MNLASLCLRDFRELKRPDEVRKLAYRWAAQLETYEDACSMVSTSFVRELMPDDTSLQDTILPTDYEQEFRKRIAEQVVYRWSLYMRRIVCEKWAYKVEKEITDELWNELQGIGIHDSKDQVYLLLVGMLRGRSYTETAQNA